MPACGCSLGHWGHDAQLSARLDEILYRLDSSGATLSACIVELASGRELYAANADTPVIPASNMKLVISSAALDTFGPDHVLKTYLAYDGENLWIIGSGDPAVGDSKIAKQKGQPITAIFDDWASQLRQRGITHIPGQLYYVDSALDNIQLHPSWDHDDLVHWYAAPVSGLNFNDNCIDVTVWPTVPGDVVRYDVSPPIRNLTIINQCKTGDGPKPHIERLAYSDIYILTGRCSKKTALKSKPVANPGAFFADAFRTHLKTAGITIDGATSSKVQPLDGEFSPTDPRIVAVHESAMTDILWRINQSSQNLFAECLCKLLGQAHDASRGIHRPGSWASGDRAIRAFLRHHGINDRALHVADGSGLSRHNRVSTRLITDILAAMFDHPHAQAFRASMAQPGSEGTARKRFQGLDGRLFAKTGYIRGVRALSGYVQASDGRWLCFSIIYNRIPTSVSPYNKLQDQAIRQLARWPDLSDE